MNILILNGNDNPQKVDLNHRINLLETMLNDSNHATKSIVLKDKKIRGCVGCFGCWVKTPGLCIIKDDMEYILREIIKSDVILFASNIEHFMVSPVIKSVIDRNIPLACAYMKVVNGKMCHHERYNTNPKKLLLVENDSHLTDRDITSLQAMITGGEANTRCAYRITPDMKEVFNAIVSN